MLLLTQVSLTTSLWLIRGVMFLLGLMMAQIFVPSQAASFAKISPADTGRASTLFNTGRQVGSAVGVAVLSTVLIGVGSTQSAGGIAHPNLRAYHLAFAAAAAFVLAATAFSLTIHDSDAAETMVRRGQAEHRAQATSVGRDRRHRPDPAGSPDRNCRPMRLCATSPVFCGSRLRESARRFAAAAAAPRAATGRTRHRAGLRRRLGRPDGRGGRRRPRPTGPCPSASSPSRWPTTRSRTRAQPARSRRLDARAQGPHGRALRRRHHAARRVRHLRGVHGDRDLGPPRHPRQAVRDPERRTASSTTS